MLRNFRVYLVVVSLLLMAGEALAAKRVALIIGNDTYIGLPNLNNARTDAQGMNKKLTALGFDTVLAVDASFRDIGKALKKFEQKLQNADVGLVFYAGHGIQANSENYLIPVDAKLEDEADLDFGGGVPLKQVIASMKRAGSDLNLIILDACRNNPLPASGRNTGTGRGLAVTSVPAGLGAKGTAILYSAAPGQIAQDGPRGGNGVFTGALLKVIATPGIPVEQVFKKTAALVSVETNGEQEPWMNSSIKGDFYFKPGTVLGSSSVTPPSTSNGGVNTQSLELAFWNDIKDSNDASMFGAYLEQYPNGSFTALARLKSKKSSRSQVQVAMSERVSKPSSSGRSVGSVFKSCPDCPEMVVMPTGSFRMGNLNGSGEKKEKPVHTVNVNYSFAVGKYEITKRQYAKFVREKGYNASGNCRVWTGPEWEKRLSASWGNPNFKQTDQSPATCISWDDAKAYIHWLNQKTGQTYRLLSEAEWEYVARAGATTKYSCGNSDSCLNGSAWYKANSGKQTHPAGQKQANLWGLYDIHGNVWEWVADCWNNSYGNAALNGDAMTSGNCKLRVLRGGSWYNHPRDLRSAKRHKFNTIGRYSAMGFRIAKTF